MTEQTQVMEALKKLMKVKGILYKDLAQHLGLSVPSVKRLFSQGDLTLSRFHQICQFLGMEMGEVFKLAEANKEALLGKLTLEQEEYLARKPQRLSYLELLMEGMKPLQIEKEFKIDSLRTTKILSDLEKWGLIKWLPGNKVQLLITSSIQVSPHGSLRNILQEKGVKSFLDSSFDGPQENQDLVTMKVSEQTLTRFNSQLKKLLRDTIKESHIENQSSLKTIPIGVFTAVRPWRLVEMFGL